MKSIWGVAKLENLVSNYLGKIGEQDDIKKHPLASIILLGARDDITENAIPSIVKQILTP